MRGPAVVIWRPLDVVLITVLFPLAALMPLPLYLVALAVFGLPHVLWELRWLQLAGQGVFSRRLVLVLAACLSILVLGRAGVLFNLPWATHVAWFDAVALMLAVLVVMPRVPRQRRPVALLLLSGLAVCLLLWRLDWLIVLLMLLSVTHNLTPLALLRWRMPAHSAAHACMLGVFMLPVLLFFLGGMGVSQSLLSPGTTLPGEAAWLASQGLSGAWFHGALSALVMLQCLHYMAVLRWLPRTLQEPAMAQQAAAKSSPLAWSGTPLWRAAWLMSIIMTMSFVIDFQDGRLLYAVAAGVHAWLEWPLLLAYPQPVKAGVNS